MSQIALRIIMIFQSLHTGLPPKFRFMKKKKTTDKRKRKERGGERERTNFLTIEIISIACGWRLNPFLKFSMVVGTSFH